MKKLPTILKRIGKILPKAEVFRQSDHKKN